MVLSSDVASVLTAIGVVIVALTGLVTAVGTLGIRKEVRTSNSLTLGQASDATESRRIDLIPPADRTVAESEHVAAVDEQSGD